MLLTTLPAWPHQLRARCSGATSEGWSPGRVFTAHSRWSIVGGYDLHTPHHVHVGTLPRTALARRRYRTRYIAAHKATLDLAADRPLDLEQHLPLKMRSQITSTTIAHQPTRARTALGNCTGSHLRTQTTPHTTPKRSGRSIVGIGQVRPIHEGSSTPQSVSRASNNDLTATLFWSIAESMRPRCSLSAIAPLSNRTSNKEGDASFTIASVSAFCTGRP